MVSECAVESVDADEDREGAIACADGCRGDRSDERGTVRLNADREREVLIECAVGMVLVMQASRMALSGRLWYTLPYRIRISRPRGGAARIVTVNGPKAGRVGSRTARYAEVTWNATTFIFSERGE